MNGDPFFLFWKEMNASLYGIGNFEDRECYMECLYHSEGFHRFWKAIAYASTVVFLIPSSRYMEHQQDRPSWIHPFLLFSKDTTTPLDPNKVPWWAQLPPLRNLEGDLCRVHPPSKANLDFPRGCSGPTDLSDKSIHRLCVHGSSVWYVVTIKDEETYSHPSCRCSILRYTWRWCWWWYWYTSSLFPTSKSHAPSSPSCPVSKLSPFYLNML